MVVSDKFEISVLAQCHNCRLTKFGSCKNNKARRERLEIFQSLLDYCEYLTKKWINKKWFLFFVTEWTVSRGWVWFTYSALLPRDMCVYVTTEVYLRIFLGRTSAEYLTCLCQYMR